MSGMIAAAGAIVCVLCLYLYWQVAASGQGETMKQWLLFFVAVLQLVPMVGGVIFARSGSRFGTWLTWLTLAGPIVWVGMKLIEAEF